LTPFELAKSLFNTPCLNPRAAITFGGHPAAVLTDGGSVVRVAVVGDANMADLGHHYPAPFTGQSFRSMFHPEDPLFMARLIQPNGINNPDAPERDGENIWDFASDQVGAFAYRAYGDLPNLHPPQFEVEGLPTAIRRIIEALPMPDRSSLVEIIAPQLWALAHRASERDYLLIECFEGPWDTEESLGYVQFKGCGASRDPFGRRWVYAESESAHQKERNGKQIPPWHADAAKLLGWRCHDRIGNDFGIFLLDGPMQAALLAEMVIDSLIALHGMEVMSLLKITLTPFEGKRPLTMSVLIEERAKTMGDLLADDLMDGSD
jgi:hypothetical protein